MKSVWFDVRAYMRLWLGKAEPLTVTLSPEAKARIKRELIERIEANRRKQLDAVSHLGSRR